MAASGTLPVLLGVGVHASRPAASAVGKGGLYSCTTHSLVYQTDGSAWTTWATLGSSTGEAVATSTIWDAAGDLAVGTGADTAHKLAAGTAGQVLVSAGAADPAWKQFPLLAYKTYAGGAATTSSTSLADADATNLAVTFTAPASTNVLVRLSARAAAGANGVGSAGDYAQWGLRESTSNIAGPFLVTRAALAPSTTILYLAASVVFVLTGISAGSHTYKWAHSTNNGSGQSQIQAASAEPATMEVWALP